ncbi:uncharacterized protein LOC106635888 [Copidosoma floridanum]|uniref:uncharacterized protein LOC106635888 n=1 Tax=Copidosoma floridanum TaxID=29053 RepID=UPI0006C9A6E5|nr:uncharacterized protein LOC106635888 [Copidosoma floridanum]
MWLENVAEVQNMLQRNSNCVNDRNRKLQTPLHFVVSLSNVSSIYRLRIMQLLIEYGADVNARDDNLETALHLAVYYERVDEVKLLLENHADPNIELLFGETILGIVVLKNVENILELLLEYGANPNIMNDENETPLDMAIRNRQINFVEKLAASGAKCNNIYKKLLKLCTQCSTPRYENYVIEYVLKHAAHLDVHDKFSPKALLYYVISKNHHKSHKDCLLFKFLCEQDIDGGDDYSGDLDLHRAVRHNNKKAVTALLQENTNVNTRNIFGDTPLHLSLRVEESSNNISSITRQLIKFGADIWAKNSINETPFLIAMKQKNINLLNYMLLKVTKVEKPTVNDETFGLGIFYYIDKVLDLFDGNTSFQEMFVAHLLDMCPVPRINNFQNIDRILRKAFVLQKYGIIQLLIEAGFRTDRLANVLR